MYVKKKNEIIIIQKKQTKKNNKENIQEPLKRLPFTQGPLTEPCVKVPLTEKHIVCYLFNFIYFIITG